MLDGGETGRWAVTGLATVSGKATLPARHSAAAAVRQGANKDPGVNLSSRGEKELLAS